MVVIKLSVSNTKAFPRIKEYHQGLLGTNRINEKKKGPRTMVIKKEDPESFWRERMV